MINCTQLGVVNIEIVLCLQEQLPWKKQTLLEQFPGNNTLMLPKWWRDGTALWFSPSVFLSNLFFGSGKKEIISYRSTQRYHQYIQFPKHP